MVGVARGIHPKQAHAAGAAAALGRASSLEKRTVWLQPAQPALDASAAARAPLGGAELNAGGAVAFGPATGLGAGAYALALKLSEYVFGW
jgi:hypothetical protein